MLFIFTEEKNVGLAMGIGHTLGPSSGKGFASAVGLLVDNFQSLPSRQGIPVILMKVHTD